MFLEKVCIFFKYGYCKYKSKCKMNHLEDECKNDDCSSENCMKRHPKACFYWMKFGNCKLGCHCAYKHGKSKEFEKIEKIETKMNEVLEKSKAKDELIKDLVWDVKELIKKNNAKEDLIKELVKEVKELKIQVSQLQVEDGDENEENEPTEEEEIESYVKYSKNSLKILDDMEADVKKSRKTDCMRKKFKIYREKLEKERMDTAIGADPPYLTWIHNVVLYEIDEDKDKEQALILINQAREQFELFIKDPVNLSKW